MKPDASTTMIGMPHTCTPCYKGIYPLIKEKDERRYDGRRYDV